MAIVTPNLPQTGIDPTQQPQTAAEIFAAQHAAHQAAQAAAVVPAVNVNASAVQAAAVEQAAEATVAVAAGTTSPAVAPAAATPPQPDAVEQSASQRIGAKLTAKKAQLEKLTAEIEKLEAQFRSADLLDKVQAGSIIVARVGRAETAREVVASVVGVQRLENGDRRLKIYFGEGFEAETVVIQDSQIVDIQSV